MLRNRLNQNMKDHIYLNANLHNITNKDIVAEYSVDIQEDYLPRSGDFYLSVIRFDIPNTLPIFDFKDNTYLVTLSYGGNDYSEYVNYVRFDQTTDKQYIQTFQHFLDLVNQALTTAFNNLKAANPAAPQTKEPYITYNSATGLFSLWCERTYATNLANSIQIFFNDNLNKFFSPGFTMYKNGVNLPDGKDYRFRITDNDNNQREVGSPPVPYFEFVQEIETLYQWYDFTNLVITTSDIPIAKEFKTFLTSGGESIQSPILTDFIPFIGKDQSNFIYNANPYRLIDLDGNLPLKRFSFKIFWADRDGHEHYYMLPPGYSLSIKFGFFRKYI